MEFFKSIEQYWKPPLKPDGCNDSWTWENPYYLYLILDFIKDVHLSSYDADLDASIIIGLRIAFKYFCQNEMSFGVFKALAKSYLEFFDVELVLESILANLNIPSQKLIMVLHIDEYQDIFSFKGWNVKSDKGLFKEMMNCLGPLMLNSKIRYYVQTFLSGTVIRRLTLSFKPTEYSFTFVQCPLLSTKSGFEIFDFFAKEKDKEGHWMNNNQVLQLLYDTSGLPRALEIVLRECFKRERFFLELKEKKFTLLDDIFHAVINVLTNRYKLDAFIANNREASYKLLYYCIGAIPVEYDTVMETGSEKTKSLNVEDLERDGFLILKKNGAKLLIEMPFYFIYIYNSWLDMVPSTIHKVFQPETKMAWHTWEIFVANYEIFHNNLFIELKKYKGVSLREFYLGAIGKDSVLDIQMGLKKLDICEAKNQFPKSGFPKNCSNDIVIKLDKLDGLVVVNGQAAQFANVFLVRKTIPEGKDLIIGFQQKWYTTSKELTIDDIKEECTKNKKAFETAKDVNLRNFLEKAHIVTVIFTSRPFKGNSKDLPDDCLIITKENFEKYFGPLFASRLTLDIINNFNINSAEPKQITEVIKGVGDTISKAIYDNRPYKSVNDLIKKNPTYENALNGVRIQLKNCSFTPHSFLLDNKHDSIMLDESLNNNNSDTEMEVN